MASESQSGKLTTAENQATCRAPNTQPMPRRWRGPGGARGELSGRRGQRLMGSLGLPLHVPLRGARSAGWAMCLALGHVVPRGSQCLVGASASTPPLCLL